MKQQSILQSRESSYISGDDSILAQALSFFKEPLPIPFSSIVSSIDCLPGSLRSQTLEKQIYSFNKSLIYDEFSYICETVLELEDKRQNYNIDKSLSSFISQLQRTLIANFTNGQQYADWIQKNKRVIQSKRDDIEVISQLLHLLSVSHASFYQFSMGEKTRNQRGFSFFNSKLCQTYVPEKYKTIVENKIDKLRCMRKEYLKQLSKQEQQQKNEIMKADQNAEMLSSFFNQRNTIQIKEQEKSNIRTYLKKMMNSFGLNSLKGFSGQKKGENKSQQPLQSNQDIVKGLVNFALNLKKEKKNTELVQVGIEQEILGFSNWFNNSLSYLSFYEAHMMCHMTDLIFLHETKFQIKSIKYSPYIEQINKSIALQIEQLKSVQEMVRSVLTLQQKAKPVKQEQKQKTGGFINKFTNLHILYDKITHKTDNITLSTQQKQHEKRPVDQLHRQICEYIQLLSQVNASLEKLQVCQNDGKKGLFQSIKNLAEQLKNMITHENDLHCYHQIQSWIAVIIIIYKSIAFSKSDNYRYTPKKRKMVINICNRIFTEQEKKIRVEKRKENNPFRNWPVVLKYLENNRSQIISDPISFFHEEQVEKIIKNLYDSINEKSREFDLFHDVGNPSERVPEIKLICLSNGSDLSKSIGQKSISTNCKVVHILISGFLSQDTNKLQQWSDLIDKMSDCEVYALVWQSNTIKNLVKFFLKCTVDILGTIKMVQQFKKKCQDNPFNPAFKAAQITGRILAELVIRLFPNRFVNVCGYSLGAEVIKQFIGRMVQRDFSHLINSVYLMGGVSDVNQYANLVAKSKSQLSIFNCYSKADLVLKKLLSLCKPDIEPIGLNDIKQVAGHKITNMDCTKFISGHLAFRNKLGLMGDLLQLNIG